ncbi:MULTISPECIES: SDR family NAD(P)-dependent oxidoreductase [Methylobacterium]|uniref:3-oxoacyl-ACP reductase n=1 Tax=Methylobacterium indicum TaxID=1775910 RepID=A0ABR5HHJ2_9HYPH|nr:MULTISPECIES: SDR family NAD(P)-dependent oxidoreductase [Methylobacterium]KMO19337.1 3-oxoacyl-ACP reductase [Methylobacterium indicum]KMO26028.1 3-oxoacyl-ACP reductase [Methylobacterium indicum]QRE76887.1 SDR family NAD(P)-dependent oxidoreductase [Methylobacterium aquaticum]
MTQHATALVVGASRGLGLALAEEWLGRGSRVIATARGHSAGLDALTARFPGSLEVESVDINQAATIQALRRRLDGRRVDVLFVNAGIARAIEASPASASEADFLDMMLTNAFSPVRAAELLRDLVPAGGTIAIMTSELGSIANATGGWQLYSSSKAALNMLMKGYAAKHADDGHAVLLVAPGWVRTEMGGSDALLSIEESIPRVVDMIEANRGRAGLRYVDRFGAPLPW